MIPLWWVFLCVQQALHSANYYTYILHIYILILTYIQTTARYSSLILLWTIDHTMKHLSINATFRQSRWAKHFTTTARYPAEHYVSCWEETEWPPLGILEAFSFERTFQKCVAIINRSACNILLCAPRAPLYHLLPSPPQKKPAPR